MTLLSLIATPLRGGVRGVSRLAARPSAQIYRRSFTRAQGEPDPADQDDGKDPATRLKDAYQYCEELVRGAERWERLVVGHLPDQHVPAVLAIRAFSLETARIRDVVSEPQFREMRFDFWENVVNRAYAQGDIELRVPVAICLHDIVRDRRLSKRFFSNIIKARKEELKGIQPATMGDIETYAEHTFSSLFYLSLEACDIRDVTTDHAASHLGKAVGITRILSGLHHHASQRRNWLPADWAMDNNVTDEQFYRAQFDAGLHEVVYQMASVAHTHLQKARAFSDKISPLARANLRHAVRCDRYLELLQKADFNPFEPSLRGPDPKLWWRINKASWQETF